MMLRLMRMNRQNVVIANTRTMSTKNGRVAMGQPTRQASAIAVNATIEHAGVAPTLLERFSGIVWKSEKPEDEGEGKGRKIPKGFEKLLRPNKQKEESEKPEEKEASKESESEKEKAEQSEEEETTGHERKKAKDSDSKESSKQSQMMQYFMEPGGGGPIWENILMAALLFGTMVYYVVGAQGPSEEVTYLDFV